MDGSNKKLYTAYYYDEKSRLTKTISSNHLGGYDVTTTTYTFTGKPATVTLVHTATGKNTQTQLYTYSYDHAERLKTITHKLNTGTPVTLVSNTYDDQGRLTTKSLHGSSSNKLAYTYNIRSWLTGIASPKFTQNLYYIDGTNTVKCYNGNISSMTWKAGDESAIRGYKFSYDELNRLANAAYGETAAISTNPDRFSEKITGYDKNGNITALQRYGQTTASAYGLIDNLSFTLNGNQLNRVDDAVSASAYNNSFEFKDGVKQANEYTYDTNGNLTKDLNKGITGITYNVLNLPSVVTFSDGSTITYTYAADGTKLRTAHKIGTTTTTTDYCGSVIYENEVQKFLLTEEGYVNLTGTQQYHYYLKDHQGNNRVVINQSGTVEETNHYYPFGGLFASTGNIQPYKYNGKEYDNKKALNWYDYGARHYETALGRFTTIDPLTEKYYSTNPYGYCLNNPIYFIDKDGREADPGDLFKTKEEAAKDWGMYYNGASILRMREMGSSIYAVKESGELQGYSYSPAKMGTEHTTSYSQSPEGTTSVATIHSHGNYNGTIVDAKGKKYKVDDNTFSPTDKIHNKEKMIIGFLATPNGNLLEHNPLDDKITVLSKDLPSDPNDPNRQNRVNPTYKPATKSIISDVIDWIKQIF